MAERTYTSKEVAELQASEGRLAFNGALARLRGEFLRLLIEDSETHDRHRKEFNQAIFDAERGFACFNGTDLGMVMDKFDRAAKGLRK